VKVSIAMHIGLNDSIAAIGKQARDAAVRTRIGRFHSMLTYVAACAELASDHCDTS
jgi:hypothetical protein